jgi:hypothetical protein
LNSEEIIKNCDYLFYSDVDMRFCDTVNTEVLVRVLLGVKHPGFFRTANPRGTPETNKASKAYIPSDTHFEYICGGFQGGVTKWYLKAMHSLRSAIDTDGINDIIPIYHDESMWNKFMTLNKSLFTFLDSDYCYPESWGNAPNLRGLTPKLLALDKNHAEMRN